MAVRPPAGRDQLDAETTVAALGEARARTLSLVAPVSDENLERVHSRLMSPLVWDLGHVAAFEDLWLPHRFGGEPLLRPDLLEVYDAFETPRAGRGELPYLRRAGAEAYLAAVRERTLRVTAEHGIGDGFRHELVLRHEAQHDETMLQTLSLAHLPDYEPRERTPLPESARERHDGLELVPVPAGPFAHGAPAGAFSYDNERPRGTVTLPAFSIGRTPITNATFLRFVEGGGYERREWWSDEGWAWKEEQDIHGPGGWTGDGEEWRVGRPAPFHPDRPVVHVSWFEAAAFARAHDARLPTEEEWEKAATWDPGTGRTGRYPWGESRPGPHHANLDQLGWGTAPAGAYPAGASPSGCLGMLGDVWEWTSSHFRAYPGFQADPYREYSEVFFGADHFVLRGGSWATRTRIATPTFRNWDYPMRRQIFSGFRIARDGAGPPDRGAS